MKILMFLLYLSIHRAVAEAIEDQSNPAETAVIGRVADEESSPLAAEVERPKFEVRNTITQKIMREEARQAEGVQPVRKEVTATVHVVSDPKLADPAPPLPALPIDDSAVIARIDEMRAKAKEREIVFVSATVYDHEYTLLRWWSNGRVGTQMTAWSNVDFNHLCGFSDYMHQGRTFSLVMGISNEMTPVGERAAEKRSLTRQSPVIPKFPSDQPAFIVTEGDSSDPKVMQSITGLHELYQKEGPRLRAAYEAREKARSDRDAYLRKNPPQPQDVTLHFWRRDQSVENQLPSKSR
ncbi:MAG: hypothetical protein HC845_06580 [Akkermansiaceae bacterium]|nr:hypothetical protein [Akkermansiaceae bacterium]